LAVIIFLLVAAWVAVWTLAYITAQRSGVRYAWAAYVPLGAWFVLFETIGRNAWLALIVFVPYVGGLVVYIWIAVEAPNRHARSGWWTVAFLIPGVNLIAIWMYALSLPYDASDLAFAA
jgi:hypothetical protein